MDTWSNAQNCGACDVECDFGSVCEQGQCKPALCDARFTLQAVSAAIVTGDRPLAVTIGDWNGDGRGDIAIANNAASSVSVLLGNGDGTFLPKTDYAVGASPLAIAHLDWNQDGTEDLVTANANAGTVSALFGNGDGTFASEQEYGLAAGCRSIAIADFDRDGHPDLAFGTQEGENVSVLLTGASFTPSKHDLPLGGIPYFVAAGDLNGDGNPDIVTLGGESRVAVLLGRGDGTFTTAQQSLPWNQLWSLTLGDLNGDGLLDLGASQQKDANGSSPVRAALGTGDAGFFSQVERASLPVAQVSSADLNGDGRAELASIGEDGLRVLSFGDDGSIASTTDYPIGAGADSLALGDLNGDQAPDVATTNSSSNALAVWLNGGDGTLASTADGAISQPLSLTLRDLDADGRLDLVVTSPELNRVNVEFGRGDGTFASPTAYSTGPSPADVAIGDLDGDGRLDIVTANPQANSVTVLFAKAGQRYARRDYEANYPSVLAIADVSGDGRADLVSAGPNAASVRLGQPNGSLGSVVDYELDASPSALLLTDLDGDGLNDIVMSDGVLSGTGAGRFGRWRRLENQASIKDLLGDVNGDGRIDLLSWTSARSIRVLLGNGDGTFTFTASIDAPETLHFYDAVLGDLDGDGHVDLTTLTSDKILFRQGTGTGTFGCAQEYAIGDVGGEAGSLSGRLAAADVNNDHRLDILLTRYHQNTLRVLLNSPLRLP